MTQWECSDCEFSASSERIWSRIRDVQDDAGLEQLRDGQRREASQVLPDWVEETALPVDVVIQEPRQVWMQPAAQREPERVLAKQVHQTPLGIHDTLARSFEDGAQLMSVAAHY